MHGTDPGHRLVFADLEGLLVRAEKLLSPRGFDELGHLLEHGERWLAPLVADLLPLLKNQRLERLGHIDNRAASLFSLPNQIALELEQLLLESQQLDLEAYKSISCG